MNFPSWRLPSFHFPMIARPRVDALLQNALQKPVTLIIAPTGFGKTTAVASLIETLSLHYAWRSVGDAAHTIPDQVSSLRAAANFAWDGQVQDSQKKPTNEIDAGVFVIDQISNQLNPDISKEINQLITEMPANGRIILIAQALPELAISSWQSQNKISLCSQQDLALTPDEWNMAGFQGGADACMSALGWWGAASIIHSSKTHAWNNQLASWIDEIWYRSLTSKQQELAGIASLLPQIDFHTFCAFTKQVGHLAQMQWQELIAVGGPIQLVGEEISSAPTYRIYIIQAWRRHQLATWTNIVTHGVHYLVESNRLQTAAQFALESGLPELQEWVLHNAGWRMLFSPDRSILGKLLEQMHFATSNECRLLQLSWRIEVDKVPHEVDNDLAQLIPRLDPYQRAAAYALSAAIAWQYDDHQRTERDAELALKSFPSDLHPAYSLTLMLCGSASLIQGRLYEAEPMLRKAQAYAARDGLVYLQLEILQRRALLASEQGMPQAALQLTHEVHKVAHQYQLVSAGIRDSASRLEAWIHLQRLDCTAAKVALESGAQASDLLGDRWLFPRVWHRCAQAMIENNYSIAAPDLNWLKQALEQRFCPQKWQNEAMLLFLWASSMRRDSDALIELERQLATCDWKPSLHTDRRRVMLAAARVLGQKKDDLIELRDLKDKLSQNGAHALAHQLALILLLEPDTKSISLWQELTQHALMSAKQEQALDYLWLGSKSVSALENLVQSNEMAKHPDCHDFLKKIMHRLLSTSTSLESETSELPTPAGLTIKEWGVLQLIGKKNTNEQIATQLHVSLATIKTHINHIYGKFNIKTRAEAIQLAISLISTQSSMFKNDSAGEHEATTPNSANASTSTVHDTTRP